MKIRKSRRGGFALVAVLMILVLLLTFLMAAQGAVMQGRLNVKRGSDRFDSAEKTGSAILDMRERLRRETLQGGRKPGDSWQYGTGDTLLLLEPDDPVYAELPLISHREGDALLTHVEIVGGTETKVQYLINPTFRRTATIRLR